MPDGWTLAGTAAALERSGAFVTCESGYTPLIVVRGQDGELRAFVNMCRHRGMALLQGCGEVGTSITCPYHAWKFDTTGALRVIPQRSTQFPDVDRTQWNLVPGHVAELAGLVFASGQPDARPLPALLDGAWTEEQNAALDAGTAGTFDLSAPRAIVEVAMPAGLTVEIHEQSLVAVAPSVTPAGGQVRVGVGCVDETRLPTLLVSVRGHITGQLQEPGQPPVIESASLPEGIPA